jgi:chromosome segregation ATPase
MAFKESKPTKGVPLDTFTQEEFRDNILDKMNFRLVFLSVIFPIVLILGLVFGYFVMDYKIREKHTLVLKEMATITKNIEGLETFLSEQTSESKKSLLDRIAVFNRTLESVQKDLKKQAATVEDLKKTKADSKTVSTVVKKELTGVTQSLDAVRGDVKKQQQTTAELTMSKVDQEKTIKSLAENLATLSETLNLLKESIKNQESAIQNLSETKADRKSLQEQERLRDKIQFLELELRLLKSQIQSPPTSSPSKKAPATKKENIIEEEVIQ